MTRGLALIAVKSGQVKKPRGEGSIGRTTLLMRVRRVAGGMTDGYVGR